MRRLSSSATGIAWVGLPEVRTAAAGTVTLFGRLSRRELSGRDPAWCLGLMGRPANPQDPARAPGRHGRTSRWDPHGVLLRWRLSRQSVRAERAHEGGLRGCREGIGSPRAGSAHARRPDAEQQHRGVSRSHFPTAPLARSGSRPRFEGSLSHLRRFSTRHPPDARGVSRAHDPPRSPTRGSFTPVVRARCRISRSSTREEPRRIPLGIENHVRNRRR